METLAFGLKERPTGALLVLSSLQWFIFTLANVVTVPVVLGQAFGMSHQEAALYTDRTFFICGIIGILQVCFGHRFSILEGPAGMWWGVFLILIQMTKDVGGSLLTLQQELEMGLLIASFVFILLAVFRLLDKIRIWFTPAVTGTYLVLLALQLSKSLVGGMLGIGFQGNAKIQPDIALLSLALIFLTIGLMVVGKGLIKNLAVLIGLIVGWIIYALRGMVHLPQSASLHAINLPALFPFGPPRFHIGIVLTCVITSVVLLSNLIASIQAFAGAARENAPGEVFTRGAFVTGIGTAITGMFGVVGAVPLTAAASLVSLTGIASRLPFLIASIGVALLGLFPKVGELVATLPSPVGYAVLFTVFGQLLGFGLRDLKQLTLDQRDLFVVTLSLLAGVGIFFIPGQAWAAMPSMLAYLVGNGLIVGVLLVLILEHFVFRRR